MHRFLLTESGIFLVVLLLGCGANLNEGVPVVREEKMSFQVAVPSTTPSEDLIYFERYGDEGIISEKMVEVAQHVWTISFTLGDLELHNDGGRDTIAYRYVRNNAGYIAAEFFEPDAFEHRGSSLERVAAVFPGKLQKDAVNRWRWFPDASDALVRESFVEPDRKFLTRIGDLTFRSAQAIQDLYLPSFDDFFESTASHIKEQGYRWVVLQPPWDWIALDPLPQVGNPYEEQPNYPPGKLREHIRAFKRAGLQVHLAPQICCTSVDTRNRDDAWLQQYSIEVERFMVEHAALAEEEGVDSFLFDVTADSARGFEDPESRLSDMLESVRSKFSGEIGTLVWVWQDEDGVPNGFIPEIEFYSFGDDLDFFVVAIDALLSEEDEPSKHALLQGAGSIVDEVEILHQRFGKPVLLQLAYPSVVGSWKGSSTIDFVTSMNTPWFPERDSKYVFNGEDQARVFDAFFSAAASRPWVLGIYNFGYWHWDMPLSPDMSVRGKPAEDLWSKWNRHIFSSGAVDEDALVFIEGRTLEERIIDAYKDLHREGSAQRVRDNFPDLELIFSDEGGGAFPSEILPFSYYYSEEADKTFNLCNIGRSVFICDGKLARLISKEDMTSGRCTVTPIYRATLAWASITG